ncbi:uncharacterized protein LOC114459639 [Gouania willdenowi]|uniref:uncharacterized protein LOC114459639 n=1 Tax=Gouania willdenowi TaxID=441366 RepID=UPI001054E4F0|nr:uncharacterized protein LOC114459639 [Gouania willdenowi]XP_028297625.1 uncharacterized protein LOC114459639 [Gouania willdenowi]
MIREINPPKNSFFFTIDIDSLYTNIDTEAGLRAVKRIFQKYPQEGRPDQEILELLTINLIRNDFEFDEKYYLQVKGTAMGKRFAPSYANIFMADWEEAGLAKCKYKPLYYVRYLDDIFGIWSHTKEDFLQFIETLNTHDPSIKLKYETNDKSIDFLDTTVYKGDDLGRTCTLNIKVFFKKTDTHALLFKSSFHPKHTYRGLVKSQLIRYDKICTKEEDFWETVKILFKTLQKRGYSRTFLRHCLKSFKDKKLDSTQKQKIPLITTFSSIGQMINHKIKNNYKKLITEQGLLQNHVVISAYRRNKNLSDYLVRAKLPRVQIHTKKNVFTDQFVKLTSVMNKTNKHIFKIPQISNVHTENCVYLIFCSNCGKQYVGETKNSITIRMNQHKYNINNKKNTHLPLVKHFLVHGWNSVRIAVIQRNFLWTDLERKKAERQWIYRLNTKGEYGLNITH